jgi:polar amino acid transport system substrate-binding protein
MTKIVMRCVAVVFLLSVATRGFSAETIRLASGEWSPYQSEHLPYYGLASRIVTDAFALAGIEVHYGYFPWPRAYEQALTGKWDGTFLWFDTPERRKHFYISDPVLDITYVFFHLKTYSFDWNTVDDLQGITIGGTLTYDYGDAFTRAEKAGTIRVERTSTDEKNFKKLLKGRIHIFPNDLEAGLAILRKHFTPEQVSVFTSHPRPVRAAPHHVLFSKKITRNAQMVERFNKGLRQLKARGNVAQYRAESRRGASPK